MEVIPGVCIKVSPSTTLFHSILSIKSPTSLKTFILSIYLYILINTYLCKFIWVSPPLKYKFRNRTGLMCSIVTYVFNRSLLFNSEQGRFIPSDWYVANVQHPSVEWTHQSMITSNVIKNLQLIHTYSSFRINWLCLATLCL